MTTMTEPVTQGPVTQKAATQKAATQKATPKDQIAAEHKALEEAVNRLAKTTDLHLLLPRLERLHHQLEHHFVGEEADGGIRKEISKLAPFLLGSLEKIFDEHRQFLDDIDDLQGKIQACLEGPLAEISDDVGGLIRRLRDHEVRETDLLRDVYYTDYGEGS